MEICKRFPCIASCLLICLVGCCSIENGDLATWNIKSWFATQLQYTVCCTIWTKCFSHALVLSLFLCLFRILQTVRGPCYPRHRQKWSRWVWCTEYQSVLAFVPLWRWHGSLETKIISLAFLVWLPSHERFFEALSSVSSLLFALLSVLSPSLLFPFLCFPSRSSLPSFCFLSLSSLHSQTIYLLYIQVPSVLPLLFNTLSVFLCQLKSSKWRDTSWVWAGVYVPSTGHSGPDYIYTQSDLPIPSGEEVVW